MKSNQRVYICEAEDRLRPGDWAHRLAGLAAAFASDKRLRFSADLKPVRQSDRQCLCMKSATETESPSLWKVVMDFARQNGLQVGGVMAS